MLVRTLKKSMDMPWVPQTAREYSNFLEYNILITILWWSKATGHCVKTNVIGSNTSVNKIGYRRDVGLHDLFRLF